jgi:hypothetical protein
LSGTEQLLGRTDRRTLVLAPAWPLLSMTWRPADSGQGPRGPKRLRRQSRSAGSGSWRGAVH